jgi:hypothetical protein
LGTFPEKEELPWRKTMEFRRCSLKGKPGVEEIDRSGAFSLIANRALFDHGNAHKFSIVNKSDSFLTNVYQNQERAENALHKLAGQI